MLYSVLTRPWMFALAFALLGLTVAPSDSARDFEVWLVDQSDSSGKTYGGTIYIYEGSDLNGEHASSATPAKIDLGAATAATCLSQTGANPVRPHMLSFNASHTHAILTFVASGHVVVFEAATRTPVACVRTTVGAGGQQQAHAAQPTPDDSYILVSNQNGKRLDRIASDYANNTFVLDASLDLANGLTPNGVPREFAGRPDNAPIIVVPDATSTRAFVTLRGGGLFVVDPRTTPIEILAEYDTTTVHPNGFGGIQANGRIYINSGAGGAATNASEFDIYRFPLSGYAASNPPNTPAPMVVYSDDTVPPEHERDAHGLAVTRDSRYVWVLDRARRVAEVFDTSSDTHVNTVELAHHSSEHPTPDLADISPSGDRIFVSLRGPNPLSGSPHAATGSTPGVGVIRIDQEGKGGELESVVAISNVDSAGVERADCHGIRVRLKPVCVARVCMRSSQYYALNLNRLPHGLVRLAGSVTNTGVSTDDTARMRLLLQGGTSSLHELNQQYVATQLSLLAKAGGDAAVLRSELLCYNLNFRPAQLSTGVTLSPLMTLGELFDQAQLAGRSDNVIDQQQVANLLGLLNGNDPIGRCN